ncbi:ribonuclease P protein component [Pseudopedobacter saltans DSM 12145]|uniref:Ribonuclease P protein component n=1 Tax=Pseudopedobacter saltans (strain ATCC 51119 / DSM 12145 / JCM 21818 / CCUG 39354 / LMG 10337 / NBRC 100064 / NCIMB 13643) TaxID=762903 RepID=F0S854_PSESL|nr:ribonuclease P protein component [Pseudopedobacter saltans]ADY52316.1 ribonuclease P protein component [Pseudopedobacter saltans DSM 12145]
MAIENKTFKKEERLCSKKLIAFLYDNGSSFLFYPYRVVWKENTISEQQFPAQVLISAPKKRFKHSVDRNLIKRRIKEAYRNNKQDLLYSFLTGNDKYILLAINYVGKEILDYKIMEEKMRGVLKMLQKQIMG